MNNKSFELALHRWPEWKISIKSGREQLCTGVTHPSLGKMRGVAQSVLAGLGFPECTMMELYWLCCVLSDYEKGTKGSSFNFHQLVLPDWFPLPFGFRREAELEFEGVRVWPPDVWSEAHAKFWGNKSPLAQGTPDLEFAMVLPADHPVRKYVKPGRSLTDTPSGETMIE